MDAFDIILLLVGAILVIVSFLFTEKLSANQNTAVDVQIDTEDLINKTELIKRDIEDYLEKAKETTIESVNDSLCHLSNEKIMNVNEYGDMVLERIDKNHSEVVFLYGMLNDKEKEIKQLIAKPNQKELELKQAVKVADKDVKVSKKQERKPEQRTVTHQAGSLMGSQAAKVERAMLEFNEEDNHEVFEARQKQILALYRQGKSVLEISKQLDIGQGEVQLVVNIFTGGSQ